MCLTNKYKWLITFTECSFFISPFKDDTSFSFVFFSVTLSTSLLSLSALQPFPTPLFHHLYFICEGHPPFTALCQATTMGESKALKEKSTWSQFWYRMSFQSPWVGRNDNVGLQYIHMLQLFQSIWYRQILCRIWMISMVLPRRRIILFFPNLSAIFLCVHTSRKKMK